MPDRALRALVVDDEQPARDELCYLLDAIESVDVVGQASNGLEALQLIGKAVPDLVFLDIQMPGLNGFEVARQLLDAEHAPAVVFVTAYDRHAIEAFEVNAVDYLLKPVEARRLETTVQRVRRRVAGAPALNDQLAAIVQHLEARIGRPEHLAVRVGERIVLVAAGDVLYASVADESINIVASQVSGTGTFRTLDELQARLDPAIFWRVHRSHLVNITKVKEIVPWFNRNYLLRMKDAKGTEIPVSRSQTRRLRDHLKL